MKFTKKLLSLTVVITMILSFSINVFSEETEAEDSTASDSITYTLSPENYATILITQSGNHTTSRALRLYYNTLDNSGFNIYAEHGSAIMSYDIPLKNALTKIITNVYIGKGGMQSGRTIPLFYDFNKFSVNAASGIYNNTSDEYIEALAYTSNYWPSSGYSYSKTTFANQLVHNILESTSGLKNYDVTEKLLTLFKENKNNYLTFATGRETNGYANGFITIKEESSLPSLTLTYDLTAVLSELNGITFENAEEIITDIGKIGLLDKTQKGALSYTTLIKAAKDYVNTEIFKAAQNGGFSSLDEFYTLYDEKVAYAEKNGVLIAINNAKTENDMKSIITELGESGALDTTACGYEGYKKLLSRIREDVVSELCDITEDEGFESIEAFYTLYEQLVSEGSTKKLLSVINSLTKKEDMKSVIDEMNATGLFDDNASYKKSVYNSLTDEMKLSISESLLNQNFTDLESFYEAYDNSVAYVYEIPAVINPENYAIIHITKDGYADHAKNAKTLGLYYNRLYSLSTYSEFGSIISGYKIPLKSAISDISIRYYVEKGGMTSGRTIPVFYDINKFDLNAESGYYAGPIDATDTTDATAATKIYTDALTYTQNYWPQSGYSYSKVPFSAQCAFNILETSSGLKTYNVTENVLSKLQESESDYITFATGRETDKYANGSFSVTTNERLPKLILKYNALSLLELINNSDSEDMLTVIDDMGKAGILENSSSGYKKFKSLNKRSRQNVADVIYGSISSGRFQSFESFLNTYDDAIINSETVISKMTISDSEKTYDIVQDAAGKTVTISAPIDFKETNGAFTAVLSEYSYDKLIKLQTKDISFDEKIIEFTHTLSENATEVKLMVLDSLNSLSPICNSINDKKGVLEGKKVIFIGNSHVYRGLTVTEKNSSVLDQETRSNDKGYFYQLCKANGMEVEVTNWTFPSHGTYHIFGQECTVSGCSKVFHEDYLTDRYFDYVFINSATRTTVDSAFVDSVDYIMEFFRKENPNVKFILLGNASSRGINEYDTPYSAVTDAYADIEKKGVTIADWGKVVQGIISGEYIVENAKNTFEKSSFVVSDQYHSNALAGYITTLTAFCAITGAKAEGQPYSFYNDTTLNSKFDISAYINKYYTNGTSDTNFHKIFESESDMRGIQKIIDKWFKEKPYRITEE